MTGHLDRFDDAVGSNVNTPAKPEPEELTDIGTDEAGDWAEGVVKPQAGSGALRQGGTEDGVKESDFLTKPGDDWFGEVPGDTKRTFTSGATRDTEDGKYDLEGFLSPLVLERYAEYMHKNRHMVNGSPRDSDNWQRGIPLDAYMKSAWRHFMVWWKLHRNPKFDTEAEMENALCALLFNVSGYLHEVIKAR